MAGTGALWSHGGKGQLGLRAACGGLWWWLGLLGAGALSPLSHRSHSRCWLCFSALELFLL